MMTLAEPEAPRFSPCLTNDRFWGWPASEWPNDGCAEEGGECCSAATGLGTVIST